MPATNRTGRVSAIDYEAGTYEVTYFDRGQSVTRQINAMSNGEYKMPEIGQVVSVSHQSNGAAAAVANGSIWNKTNKPAEGFKGLYRKEYGQRRGQAYDRYDANTGVYEQRVNGENARTSRICQGEIYDEAAGPATFSGGGQVQVLSRNGSASVQGKTGVGVSSQAGISIEAEQNASLEGKTGVGIGSEASLTLAAALDILLNAGRSLVITVGGNSISISADGSVGIDAGESGIHVTAGGDAEITAGGSTVAVSGSGTVQVSAGGSSITVDASGNVGITGSGRIDLSAPVINISGESVNISGTDGGATINGKSLTGHKHTDSYGGQTSAPI